MRYAPCLALVASCLGLASCSSLGKKAPAPSKPPPRALGDGQSEPRATLNPDRPETPGTLASSERSGTASETGGLIAGQIIDSINQRPPPTSIQVSYVKEQGAEPQQVMEVAASPEGYFVIQGLQPGRYYRLTARARLGDRLLAGATWARPPDPRVVIQISEDLATKSTPPVPPSPAYQAAPKDANRNSGTTPPVKADPTWGPGRGGSTPEPEPKSAADLGRPERLNDTNTQPAPSNPPPPPANSGANLENIAERLAKTDPPTASINTQVPAANPTATNPTPNNASATAPPFPVPGCSLTGSQLHNLALRDLNGQTWEYRQHPARLTLIDFWGPWCGPCRDAIPHLNMLQQDYGPHGLQVVGVAYERDVEPVRLRQIHDVAGRLRVNYTMLLGSDRVLPDGRRAMCPVRQQFAPSSFPTLVLIDQNGRIVRRWEGLGPGDLEDLSQVIRSNLGVR